MVALMGSSAGVYYVDEVTMGRKVLVGEFAAVIIGGGHVNLGSSAW